MNNNVGNERITMPDLSDSKKHMKEFLPEESPNARDKYGAVTFDMLTNSNYRNLRSSSKILLISMKLVAGHNRIFPYRRSTLFLYMGEATVDEARKELSERKFVKTYTCNASVGCVNEYELLDGWTGVKKQEGKAEFGQRKFDLIDSINPNDSYIRIPKSLFISNNFVALGLNAQVIYIDMLRERAKQNSKEGFEYPYKLGTVHMSLNTVKKCVARLLDFGFIESTDQIDGSDRKNEYKLSTLWAAREHLEGAKIRMIREDKAIKREKKAKAEAEKPKLTDREIEEARIKKRNEKYDEVFKKLKGESIGRRDSGSIQES